MEEEEGGLRLRSGWAFKRLLQLHSAGINNVSYSKFSGSLLQYHVLDHLAQLALSNKA